MRENGPQATERRPTPIPVMAFSDVGMSNTRSEPNCCCNDIVVPKTPFGSGTPRPYTMTRGSCARATASPSRIAAAKFILLMRRKRP